MVILEIAQTPLLLEQMMRVCLQDDCKTESLQTSVQVVKHITLLFNSIIVLS